MGRLLPTGRRKAVLLATVFGLGLGLTAATAPVAVARSTHRSSFSLR
jgi:hypothetical protein